MKLQTTKPVTLRLPPFRRVYLTLVGVGGTGSHIASGLAALALALRERDVRTDLFFIDMDTVEDKNIGRQLFTRGDLGKYKSQVLAQRMLDAYGLPVLASTAPIDAGNTFLSSEECTLHVVIGAVDNPAARALIAKSVKKAAGRLWWVDAGNENISGQIALGNSVDPKRWRPALGMVDSLPAPHVLYPDLIRAPKVKNPRRNCAEATAVGEQGLMVNRMAAAWSLSMLHDFFLGRLQYFTLDFDLVFGGTRARMLDAQTLKEIIS